MKIVAARPATGYNHVGVLYKDDPHVPNDLENRIDHMWVPWDYDEDRLADAWEHSWTDPDSLSVYDYDTDTDDDPHTPTSNVGDGYWAFDEYRGIKHEGTWTRLNPTKKELCITTTLGIGNVAGATGLTVYEVEDDTEMSSSSNTVARYNPASSTSAEYNLHQGQKGIRIIDKGGATPPPPASPKALGAGPWNTPNATNDSYYVKIYTGNIHDAVTTPRGELYGVPYSAVLTRVITHECCHDLLLTPAGVVDDEGMHHHEPNAGLCAMDKNVTSWNYQVDTLCTDCRNAVTLHWEEARC